MKSNGMLGQYPPILKSILGLLLVFLIGFCAGRIGREPENNESLREKIIGLSRALIGLPYQYGGYDISGFDCSGFVYYVFSAFGIEVPRTAKMQGKLKNRIALRKARPGDIFIFKLERGWHSGIFSGNSRFIHAPNPEVRVTEVYLNNFWLYRLEAVIRVFND